MIAERGRNGITISKSNQKKMKIFNNRLRYPSNGAAAIIANASLSKARLPTPCGKKSGWKGDGWRSRNAAVGDAWVSVKPSCVGR